MSHKIMIFTILSLFLGACSTKQPKQEAPAPAKAAATEPAKKPEPKVEPEKPKNRIVCKLPGDERAIQVVTGADRKVSSDGSAECQVVYSKFGNSDVVASAQNGVSHCEEISSRIRANLEKAGFSCQ
jgi:hypothetical protein